MSFALQEKLNKSSKCAEKWEVAWDYRGIDQEQTDTVLATIEVCCYIPLLLQHERMLDFESTYHS